MGATTLIILVLIGLGGLMIAAVKRLIARPAPPKPPYFNNEAEWAQNAPSGPLYSIRPTIHRLAYTLSVHRYRDEVVAYVVVFHDHFPPMPEADYPHRHFQEAVRYAWHMQVIIKEWGDYVTALTEATQKFEAGLATLQQSGWWVDSRPSDTADLKYYRLTRS